MLGPAEPSTLVSINNLGTLLFERGELEGANTLVHEALHLRQSMLGPLDPATLRSMDTLSQIQRAKGDLTFAAATATQVLEGRRKVLGPTHTDTIRAMNVSAALGTLSPTYLALLFSRAALYMCVASFRAF